MDPKDKLLLQKILDEKTFGVLQRVANSMIMNWASRPCTKETGFETIKATIQKESKVDALKAFLEELERQAYDRE